MNKQAGEAPHGDLWLYRRVSGLVRWNYRAKIMLVAFVGTHVPLLCLAAYVLMETAADWQSFMTVLVVTLAATLLGTALTLFVIDQLLRPVLKTSRALRAYRETRQCIALPDGFTDEVGTLMADAGRTIAHLEATLDALEHIDEATHLPNRRRFEQMVDARLARGEAFAVAVVRLANHSRIAETLEFRQAGEAMRQLAGRFAQRAELRDGLARVGPAEFACFVDTQALLAPPWGDTAGRLRPALEACAGDLPLDRLSLKPVLQGGVSAYPEDGDRSDTLIDRAITAACTAQHSNQVVLHSADARRAAIDLFVVEQDLRRAIERDELELHYQPIIDVQAGRAVGAEALIRWRHPERGLMPPSGFIDVAEASGLIDPIGLWVLRHACAQVRAWNDAGRDKLRAAVNLSARQFLDPGLKGHILEAIRTYGISPDQIEIELTETAAMVDHEHTRRVFTSLRDEGIGIAIDDFGTGYASMSYLRKLPFDKLKIDREFVSEVNRTRHGQAICGALIELARGLELDVLAEGAETEAEVRHLAERGCGLFQGYYFSRPLPAQEFAIAIDAKERFALPANVHFFDRRAAGAPA